MLEDAVYTRGITKFDGNDYLTWKFQVTQMIMAHGLEDLLDGSNPKPAGENSKPEVKKWIKDNAKAMSLLSQAIEKKQLQTLITSETAKEMWDGLKNMYDQKSSSSKLLLRQKFHESKMKSNETVIEFVTKIQNLVSQLKDVGEVISDIDVMAKILGTLPSKYNTLVTSWDSVSHENQNIGTLLQRLIKEETKIKIEDERADALAITSNYKRRNQNTFKNKQDYSDKGRHQDHKKGRNKIQCYNCKRFGHFAAECRKKRHNNNHEMSAYITTYSDKPVTKIILNSEVETLMEAQISDVWLADSGASRHVTYRRDWFNTFSPCYEETVFLGDGAQCRVQGKGTILIKKLLNNSWCEARIENVFYVPELQKNLLSVGVCALRGYEIKFKGKDIFLIAGGKISAQGYK